jgi:hypothetical protein
MGPPVRVALPLGGAHEVLPRGSLAISPANERFVHRSIPGAYDREGALADDTLRSLREKLIERDAVPGRPPLDEIAAVHEEEVVWGGNIVAGYGHFLTEAVSRLWSVLPGAPLEGRPAVFTMPRNRPVAGEWLAAFGVEAVELPERGTALFKRMRVPESAWRLGRWIAPELREIHLHARRGLEMPDTPRRDVLWLSRGGLPRRQVAYDEGLLEWLLAETVAPVRLETMALAEQVAALEGCRAVAGVAGSAFHTLLLTLEPPASLYLFPFTDKPNYATQHRLLDAEAAFEPAVGNTMQMRRARERILIFPGGYRVLVPEALRALRSSVLPELFDDHRLAAFGAVAADGKAPRRLGDELDDAAMQIVREPFLFAARLALGKLFEERGLARCALEQYDMVAELSEEPAETRAALAGQERVEGECE